MKYPIVEVYWNDAAVQGGWRSMEEYQKRPLAHCTSVGYLVKKDKERVIVLQSRGDPPHEGSDSMTIPRGCVTRIVYLLRKP